MNKKYGLPDYFPAWIYLGDNEGQALLMRQGLMRYFLFLPFGDLAVHL
jgi:hypothetical protein